MGIIISTGRGSNPSQRENALNYLEWAWQHKAPIRIMSDTGFLDLLEFFLNNTTEQEQGKPNMVKRIEKMYLNHYFELCSWDYSLLYGVRCSLASGLPTVEFMRKAEESLATHNNGKRAAGIRYVTGDATWPRGDGTKFIVHICNDIGAWGSGFVTALSRRWPVTERAYREWFKNGEKFELGNVQLVRIDDTIVVFNMIAQHGIKKLGNEMPIRYDALAKCLCKVAKIAQSETATVHMPRIGCDRAGGSWLQVEKIIRDTLVAAGLNVTVYKLPV